MPYFTATVSFEDARPRGKLGREILAPGAIILAGMETDHALHMRWTVEKTVIDELINKRLGCFLIYIFLFGLVNDIIFRYIGPLGLLNMDQDAKKPLLLLTPGPQDALKRGRGIDIRILYLLHYLFDNSLDLHTKIMEGGIFNGEWKG